MDIRKSSFRTLFLLALISLFALPLPLGSQCMTAITAMGTSGTPAYVYIGKSATNANTCTLTMFMNAFGCFPGNQFPPVTGVTGMGGMLTASAYTTATNPSCGWVCDCGAITIDTGDGLPVELMGFEIED